MIACLLWYYTSPNPPAMLPLLQSNHDTVPYCSPCHLPCSTTRKMTQRRGANAPHKGYQRRAFEWSKIGNFDLSATLLVLVYAGDRNTMLRLLSALSSFHLTNLCISALATYTGIRRGGVGSAENAPAHALPTCRLSRELSGMVGAKSAFFFNSMTREASLLHTGSKNFRPRRNLDNGGCGDLARRCSLVHSRPDPSKQKPPSKANFGGLPVVLFVLSRWRGRELKDLVMARWF